MGVLADPAAGRVLVPTTGAGCVESLGNMQGAPSSAMEGAGVRLHVHEGTYREGASYIFFGLELTGTALWAALSVN